MALFKHVETMATRVYPDSVQGQSMSLRLQVTAVEPHADAQCSSHPMCITSFTCNMISTPTTEPDKCRGCKPSMPHPEQELTLFSQARPCQCSCYPALL